MMYGEWNVGRWTAVRELNSPMLVIDETRTYNRIKEETNAATAYDRTAWVFVAHMNWLIPKSDRMAITDMSHPNVRVQMTVNQLIESARKMDVYVVRLNWQIWLGNAQTIKMIMH